MRFIYQFFFFTFSSAIWHGSDHHRLSLLLFLKIYLFFEMDTCENERGETEIDREREKWFRSCESCRWIILLSRWMRMKFRKTWRETKQKSWFYFCTIFRYWMPFQISLCECVTYPHHTHTVDRSQTDGRTISIVGTIKFRPLAHFSQMVLCRLHCASRGENTQHPKAKTANRIHTIHIGIHKWQTKY